MTKQRCDICGKKYECEVGLFKYTGIPKSKWRKLKPELQKATPYGQKAICKNCQ